MSSANSSLRPAWNRGSGGRGFQPPPAVERSRSQSVGSENGPVVPPTSGTFNKFAALDDDDEQIVASLEAPSPPLPKSNHSRSEGLRSSMPRTSHSNAPPSKTSGRSLADLAARTSEGGAPVRNRNIVASRATEDAKVTRYTRERLLSLRPEPPLVPPGHVAQLLHNTVLLMEHPQDPVCWDTFDPEEIWAAVLARRSSSLAKGSRDDEGRSGIRSGLPARTSNTGGRWQRGVALPPPDSRNKPREKDAETPGELWDDPNQGGAAADFSAFGGHLDGPQPDDGVFDFEKMAEQSRLLEDELHGPRSRTSSGADVEPRNHTRDAVAEPSVQVNPQRPLAAMGTTIQSGSGDNVNVFEDFDDPAPPNAAPAIRAVDEDPTASSRLMAMIGVEKDPTTAVPAAGLASAWGAPVTAATTTAADAVAIPLNPWGGPLLPTPQPQPDLQARLRQAEMEKARAAELRHRQEQELVQRQAEERARQQQNSIQQQEQQAGVQTQVETVLLERITSILEKSWGRADLSSILSTLHEEDSRVIALLNNIDLLRTLLLRHPRRVAVRQDPAFGAEMAVLLLTKEQWQQQQQQEARVQQEEGRRLEQKRLVEERQKAAARDPGSIPVVADAPWFYSDPQRNIQGPFRGEEMRQWLEAGYFKGDLPICQQPTGPFHPLAALFPDLSKAFMARLGPNVEHEMAQAEEEKRNREAKERAERERQAQEAKEQQRRAQEVADREAREILAKSNGANESSNQLKVMLGMPDQSVPSPPQPKSEKKSKSKKAKEVQPVEPRLEAVKPTAPAWGGVSAAQPNARKSMSEIQREEARAAALLAMQQQNTRPSGSGWANVAASKGGSTAWSGGAAKATAAAVVNNLNTLAPSAAVQARAPPQGQGAMPPKPQTAQQRENMAASSVSDEFGAKMSPSFEKWCKDQVYKLNGTDDLTLVAFCMTLQDPGEIRQYLSAYLGSTPQVNSFATEFINRKAGKTGPQEEWEPAAISKKKGKKKVGGR
jgi:hypothetical protein